MFTKLDHVENQDKRKNIIADGMADEKGENWNELEVKDPNIPPVILEDFSGAGLPTRKELWPELKAARDRGDSAALGWDKLTIQPRAKQPMDTC